MVEFKQNSCSDVPSFRALCIVRSLVAGAIALTGYLAWAAIRGGAVLGCGASSNCDQVLKSKWGYWFGIPVSLIALVVYGTFLVGTFWLGGNVPPRKKRFAWNVLIVCAFVAFGAALWFVGLQLAVLHRICPLCLAAHACGLSAAAMLIWQAPHGNPPQQSSPNKSIVNVNWRWTRNHFLVAAAALTVLGFGQSLDRRQTQLAKRVPTGIAAEPRPKPDWQIQILDGQFQLKLGEVPLVGRTDAKHVIVCLLDYTCFACRVMHGQLLEAQATYANDLAIVILPTPLDLSCNPAVKQTYPAHVNACEFARIGLAVWRAEPTAFGRFGDFVLAPESPPPLRETRRFAAQLVGEQSLEQRLHDPWIEDLIKTGTAIYQQNLTKLGNESMPQLIIGTNVTFGAFRQIDRLYGLLADHLGLKQKP